MWVYRHDVETKMQLSQGVGKVLPRPKEARMSRSKIKVLLVVFFFNWKSIVNHEFVPRGQMVNKQFLPGNFGALEGCCAQEDA